MQGPNYYIAKMVTALDKVWKKGYQDGKIDKRKLNGLMDHYEHAPWKEVSDVYFKFFGKDKIMSGYIKSTIDMDCEIFSETGMTMKELVEDAVKKDERGEGPRLVMFKGNRRS